VQLERRTRDSRACKPSLWPWGRRFEACQGGEFIVTGARSGATWTTKVVGVVLVSVYVVVMRRCARAAAAGGELPGRADVGERSTHAPLDRGDGRPVNSGGLSVARKDGR
jgi:hypothetical protein